MRHVVRIELHGEPDAAGLEADVALAIFTAECLYGKPRVRLEVTYMVADEGRACVLDVGGEAGDAAARVFSGLVAARVGEEAFVVRRGATRRRDHLGRECPK